ncbi:MAG: 30S ribosomal protein S24e [Candidatus Altiarchaeales archaeon HGW-Altiarchaeales-3]|nr:MAG: 30S ribosomal protein S24e [Candidatus Altiarchaeales archaeon HGW-Altiarchaeales-3]
MEIEILSEKENPLLKRKEINFRAIYKGATPNINELRTKLIQVLKSDASLTVVDTLKSEFGRTAAKGYAKIYENSDALSIEPEHIIKKNSLTVKEEASKENKEVVQNG